MHHSLLGLPSITSNDLDDQLLCTISHLNHWYNAFQTLEPGQGLRNCSCAASDWAFSIGTDFRIGNLCRFATGLDFHCQGDVGIDWNCPIKTVICHMTIRPTECRVLFWMKSNFEVFPNASTCTVVRLVWSCRCLMSVIYDCILHATLKTGMPLRASTYIRVLHVRRVGINIKIILLVLLCQISVGKMVLSNQFPFRGLLIRLVYTCLNTYTYANAHWALDAASSPPLFSRQTSI